METKTLDATPLQKAADAVRRKQAEIADNLLIGERVKKEVEDYLVKINPSDLQALEPISNKQLQLQILPGYIDRLRRQLEPLQDNLLKALDEFQYHLRAVGVTERDCTLERMTKKLLPFTGDDDKAARNLAHQLPGMGSVPVDHEGGLRFPSGFPPISLIEENVLRSALERADAFLKIAADWEKNGRSFLPAHLRK